MIIYRLKSKNVVYDLYLPEESNGKAVLYVPGLPGHPRRKALGETFASNGFSFFEMRFPGSWESNGEFTMDNCVKSLEEAYDFIKSGLGTELRREIKKEWEHKEIIFLGSSFGGGVILSSQIKEPLKFALLAPVTKIKNVKDSLVMLSSGEDDLFNLLTKGYANAYRGLNKKDWNRFLDGESLINPEKNTDNLKNKKLLFLQGTDDDVIFDKHTSEYVNNLKKAGVEVEFILISGAGHGGDLEEKAAQTLVDSL
ncbi:MAG: prolyl oligopeptidase family serine peptidase [Candidatus Paceibacterota bacterium]